MKKIISLLIIFVTFSFCSYSQIRYFTNDNADIIIDIQKNKITFFAFGGSSSGQAADFAINSIIKQNELGQYIGNMQDLYISEIFNYNIDRPNRKINFEINNKILEITELDCFGICPLFSNFLNTYEEKKEIPQYLIDMFQESQMKQNNILYNIKLEIVQKIACEDDCLTITNNHHNIRSFTHNNDSIYIENNNLYICLNDTIKEYEDLIVNAMSLTTDIILLNNNEFYLIYQYNASSTKMQHIYKYTYCNGLFLSYKEIVKLNIDKSCSHRMYFNNFEITDQKYHNLEDIGRLFKPSYDDIESKAITKLVNQSGNEIGTIYYNISNLERYIKTPVQEEESIRNIDFVNVHEVNNIAYYLEQSGQYSESVFLLERILKKFPNRTVAYINLGDAYWGLGKQKQAKEAYEKYIELMKTNGKESKIPQRVYERIKKESTEEFYSSDIY